MAYRGTCNDFKIEVNQDGAKMHDYAYGVELKYLGKNSETRVMCSVADLHDLRFLIDRALIEAERKRID